MRFEYLLFDILIAIPLVAIACLRPRWLKGWWAPAWRASLWGSLPFVIWDACVTGRHWWFHEDRVLGPRLFGLPLEELGFFLVVPWACLLTWELLGNAALARPSGHGRRTSVWLGGIAVLTAAVATAAALGLEYTALATASLGVAWGIDHALGTRLAAIASARRHAGFVVLLTTVFNGYLTGRPIVLYDPQFLLGLRIGTIPLEDYAFGLSLVWVTTVLYQQRRGRTFAPSWLARAIRARFGGYVHRVVHVDPTLPERLPVPRRVAVVGGGLAGLGAAELLSRRGFEVDLFEREDRLGGKVAGWRETLSDGFDAHIEHGFHAFFRHYYNLDTWLSEMGVRAHLRPISDYAIYTRAGDEVGFAGASAVPLLNLMGLAKLGFFRWRDVLRPTTARSLESLLRYDAAVEDSALDRVSFATWAEHARLPPRLRLAFTTFARAFFAEEGRVSMAELVKSFHFYYLSHDRGLLYDYLEGAYDEVLIAPIVARLRARGVRIHLGRGVDVVESRPDGTISVDGVDYDHVVLASDVSAAARIIRASPTLAQRPEMVTALRSMRAGQRYAVLRLWIDRPLGHGRPVFFVTERETVLDAIAFSDRTDPHARAWAVAHEGCVIELHCYAVPDTVADADVERSLVREAYVFLPELEAATVLHRHLQLRDDFNAIHVGMRADRPGVVSGVSRLYFAGDWVKLPCPAMLMEAAHTSARLAADRICACEGVAGFHVDSVPLRGALAQRSKSPA